MITNYLKNIHLTERKKELAYVIAGAGGVTLSTILLGFNPLLAGVIGIEVTKKIISLRKYEKEKNHEDNEFNNYIADSTDKDNYKL
jgi:hypothetical protein